ncbi:hypothetical protein D3C73_1373570 [compost metagenome]
MKYNRTRIGISMIHKHLRTAVKHHVLIKRVAHVIFLEASQIIGYGHARSIHDDRKLGLMIQVVLCGVSFTRGMEHQSIA